MPTETRRMTDAEFEAAFRTFNMAYGKEAFQAYSLLYREALAARAEARALRGCLAALQEAKEEPVNPSEAYDAKAEAFYRETGLLAPGKDAPPGFGGSREERQEAWLRWLGKLAEEAGEEARRGA